MATAPSDDFIDGRLAEMMTYLRQRFQSGTQVDAFAAMKMCRAAYMKGYCDQLQGVEEET